MFSFKLGGLVGSRALAALSAAALTGAALGSSAALAQPTKVGTISFIGEVTFPTATFFDNTQVGGLSGITYDAERNVYYTVSDDRSSINPARFYTVAIDLAANTLAGVQFTGVTTLLDGAGQPFAASSIDPEGIAFTGRTVYISSEGEVSSTRIVDPFVNRFALNGEQNRELPVPLKFLPYPATVPTTVGIRNNLALESLTLTPNKAFLYSATENALVQDGPQASLSEGSPSRILRFNTLSGRPTAEYLYPVEPIPNAPVPPEAFATNGLVDLLALDDEGTLLALERAFSEGVGNTVKLYEISTAGATDIRDIGSLSAIDIARVKPVQKRLLLDLAVLGIVLDNLEGLTLGPTLGDGRRALILVSDNNFSETQFTQFLGFAVDLVPGR
ncbi:esterase-like activity of phytase family protein [Gloeobacter violaceus]|nr:esterase-like activity of phytase family protein [Gloeobacter violaceus]